MEHAIEFACERSCRCPNRILCTCEGNILTQHKIFVKLVVSLDEIQLCFRTDQLVQIVLRQVLILSSRSYGRQRISW